jgi:ABC-type transporter Mla subunit MlaD
MALSDFIPTIQLLLAGIPALAAKITPEFEADIDKVAQFVEKVAPIVEKVCPLFGADGQAAASAAGLADTLATGIDTIYQQHQAAGATPEATTAAAAQVANLVAANAPALGINPATVTKITTITAAIPGGNAPPIGLQG